ncbi:MAG TPA: zinc-dependent metalloprotease family protein [Chitinophagaceae bacterium]|jgi:hypothetical protein|nr:zinc-dependent metalloprotease family protein [Chitinophagaceae bacterium]
MKKLVLIVLSFTIMYPLMAQEKNYWSSKTDATSITTDKAVSRLSFPKEFKLYDLNREQLKQDLFKVAGNASAHSVVITLPNAEGQIELFEVVEASNFEPDLQARFPEIRAFSGKGITDPSATLKLSYSPQGIQTMVFRTEKPNEFMEPYSRDHNVYAVFRSSRSKGSLQWTCSTEDRQLVTELNARVTGAGIASRSGGDLKTMRLAQSCNAEYSNFFGATSSAQVGLVLAAFNATLTRCNGVYEKDLALHLNLISNTTSVIYYNPSTDPYSTTLSQWNSQLQSTLTATIGEANYDIGHMFGASGGGGNAGCIGCVCVNGSKGSGITSPADGIPQGDNFDIDYVVHEVGHQLGGNHTFSMSNEGSGVNKEPGSGITIMGYAGITAQDLAPHSIDIYHQATIAQIQANLATKTCPVTTTISNATPVIAALTNYTIPKSTPFALTGSATDANPGNVLTYCWEQNDNASSAQTGASSVASATKATGPNWISVSPTTSPTRLFPKLATILTGGLISGPLPGGDAGANTEALSSVARTLNFRLTVRDNAPFSSTAPVSVGQTQFRDMVVTVNGTAGPFSVTAPNTAVSYAGGSAQTITWAVAGTTAAPVSCANVKISLSTDGGQTFPTVLTASTANDGTEALVIPNTPTTTARIKIESVGNIFFDICNTNFTITAGSGCGTPGFLSSTAITTSSATVLWATVAGATSYDVDYKLNSSGTWTNAVTGTTSISVNLSGLASGSLYDWRVRANCTSGSSSYAQSQFTTIPVVACNAPTGLSSSGITASAATVSWTAASGAVSYDVDYKTNASGTWTNAVSGTGSTSVNLSGLTASTLYDWRVRTNCASGSSGYTQAQFTTLAVSGCGTAFEPNESIAAAATISTSVANSAAITTSTDNDYFRIVTSATSNNVFTLAGPSGVDYDMTIYNSAGTSIGSGTSGTANESVSLNNQPAGTYYIRIFGYNGASSATCYTITATATVITGCSSIYDVSTNGTSGGAATIPFNTDVKGLISPTGDVDFYKFVITTGGTATVTLSTLPGDYDLQLLSSNGTTQLAVSENGGTSSETITRTYTAGTYYLRVYGYNGANSATVCYTLRAQLGTASREELLITATKVAAFPNPVTDKVNLDIPGIKGMARITVFDGFGKMVLQSTTANSNSQLNLSKLPSGIYMIKVMNDGKESTVKIVKE